VRWGFQRAGGGEMENVCNKDETYGRPVHRWKDNIKMVLHRIGFYGINWIHIRVCKVGASYAFLRTR
jgi:hypothetical protein